MNFNSRAGIMLKLGLKKNDCRWGCYSSEKENKDNCMKKRLFDDLPANNEESFEEAFKCQNNSDSDSCHDDDYEVVRQVVNILTPSKKKRKLDELIDNKENHPDERNISSVGDLFSNDNDSVALEENTDFVNHCTFISQDPIITRVSSFSKKDYRTFIKKD